jgi:hypothetical protein
LFEAVTAMARTHLTRRVLLLAAALAVAFAPAASAAPPPPAPDPAVPPASTGQLFVLNAVAGVPAEASVDGEDVGQLAPKGVAGPLDLPAGPHEVALASVDGAAPSATVEVPPGGSLDAVVHLPADPSAGPVVTAFPNDLSPVPPERARLVVAHTAVVPPADLRVDGQVLFRNIANGEALTLVVPARSYTVDVVPTGTDGPVVFGPVTVDVPPATLLRVFALGSPSSNTMDALVQALPVPVEGAGMMAEIGTGDGGQVAAGASRDASDAAHAAALLAGAALAGLLLVRGRVTGERHGRA